MEHSGCFEGCLHMNFWFIGSKRDDLYFHVQFLPFLVKLNSYAK
jgi:hypothetical protein